MAVCVAEIGCLEAGAGDLGSRIGCSIKGVKLTWDERRVATSIPNRPVITHPMVGVRLNRWVTVDALRSLSYEVISMGKA